MKNVKGFEDYFVTRCGKVYSNKSGSLVELTLQENRDGYWVVNLYKDKESHHKRVNRLVAEVFVTNPNEEEYDTVHHKDDDRKNNHYLNLEWCTQLQNNDYKIENGRQAVGEATNRTNLTKEVVLEIYQRLLDGAPLTISEEYGVDGKTIHRIKSKEVWKHVTKDLPDIAIRTNHKTTTEDVEFVCQQLVKGVPQAQIARDTGLSPQVINKIKTKKSYVNISSKYTF